jgi:hypothetical protein
MSMGIDTTLVAAAGLYNLGFAVFHLMLGRLFAWPSSLVNSGNLNCAITQTLNVVLIYSFVVYGGALLWLSARGPSISTILAAGGGFWLLRAIVQPVLFGMPNKLATDHDRLRYWSRAPCDCCCPDYGCGLSHAAAAASSDWQRRRDGGAYENPISRGC